MAKESVVIRTYPTTGLADMACMLLESEGIKAKVIAFTGKGSGIYTYMTQLLIPAEEAERAAKILEKMETTE
ncbi:MAG: hypothetical protein WCH86_09235 [Kiritimatiellales bacterium]